MRDQVVLITGAHGGIGAAMVSAFAESDATVIGSDRGTKRPDAAAACYDFDVTDEAAAADVVSDVVSKYGRIDALVHAAGVLGETVEPGVNALLSCRCNGSRAPTRCRVLPCSSLIPRTVTSPA